MTIDANGKMETNGHSQNVAGRMEFGNSGEGTSVARGIGNMSDGCQEAVPVQQQQQQQRSQGSMVHWETFLHITSIRVLLVENDDSTRHVVAALLRNLNYEVVVAANGLQAWRILEDLANHIDIVLTEVVMPCFSGIGLLCKIMSHKTRKNIPVIMMSSHDSMGLVFKCLSKGAVDFLGKPIRKNELKNLWQHVWRRCHSSSGSGGESRTQTQLSVKSKSGVKSEKNRNSLNEGDNMSTELKTVGTDEDSDSQSSWTKEVDSSQAMSSRDQIAKRSHSTCAQLCTHTETSTETMVPVTALTEYHKNDIDEHNDSVFHGKDSSIEKSKTLQLLLNNTNEVPSKLTDANRITNPIIEPKLNKTRGGKNPANHRDHILKRDKAIITETPSPQMVIEDHVKTLNCNSEAFEDSKNEQEIELHLKRLRGSKDTGKANQTDRNVLRRTDLSTFSSSKRHTSNCIKIPNGINLTCSEDTVKDKLDRPCSNRNLLCPSSDRGKNIVDVGSSTDKLPINPTVFSKDKINTTLNRQEPTAAINDMELSTVFATTDMDLNRTPHQVILVKTDDLASPALLTPIKGSPRELPVQHIHHHHHLHHFHNMDREQPLTNIEDLPYNKLDEESPHLKSMNVFLGPVEGNTRNCSLNKSGSGSKHGSNGQNASSTIVQAGGTNIESDVHIAGKSASGDASGSGSRNRIDQNRCAHREASLTKFRPKKERRVVNKARHQNKKRLAE